MLDKILDIQHPERVKGKLQAVKPKVAEKKLLVSTIPSDWNVSLLDTGSKTAPITGYILMMRLLHYRTGKEYYSGGGSWYTIITARMQW